MSIHGRKAGYYSCYLGYDLLLPGLFDTKAVQSNRNAAVTLVLKKVLHPAPMYVHRVDIAHRQKPAVDKALGFDLFNGDWVAPYGKGTNAHMFFTWHIDYDTNDVSAIYGKQNRYGWESKLIITFPNPGDGIQQFQSPHHLTGAHSELRSSHEAPQGGYRSELVKLQHWHPNPTGTNNYDHLHNNYYLRVQTTLDSHGKVKTALYGKIYGDFESSFWTYLNPEPNSRNIESDPNRALSRDAKSKPMAHRKRQQGPKERARVTHQAVTSDLNVMFPT